MPTGLERDLVPAGYKSTSFLYQGRPAVEQNDFGKKVGLCDMIRFDIDVDDDKDNEYFHGTVCSYYHAGVVLCEDDDTWWVYLEWGRVDNSSLSWESDDFCLDFSNFMFVECDDEDDARAYFEKKCQDKNIKRIKKQKIGGVNIWVPKGEKRGYIVQDLAQRMRGLPDAHKIILQNIKKGTQSSDKVLQFARDMAGGSFDYTRSLIMKSGAVPTLKSIDFARTQLIPAAMKLIKKISPAKKQKLKPAQLKKELKKQYNNPDLILLSEYTATIIPRPIPKFASKKEKQEIIILSQNKILDIQKDLDVFESVLHMNTSKIYVSKASTLLGAELTWISKTSKLGKWIASTMSNMTNNRHFSDDMVIKNIFAVSRSSLDKRFIKEVKKIAKKRKGVFSESAGLQPVSRPDMSEYKGNDVKANLYIGIHGTRAVNVLPILKGNLRLPQTISGVHITGADFGSGIYFAIDWKKSYGYVGADDSFYGTGGQIDNRKCFLFLCDVIMGEPYQATGIGSWSTPPNGLDSIAMFPKNISTLRNEEHVVFSPDHQRIRYIIEFCREAND
jgi:hypothetical protein